MNAPPSPLSSATRDRIENRTYGELRVGDSASLVRTLGDKDIELFAIMSGDVNPAHVDEEFARSDSFHRIVVEQSLRFRRLGIAQPRVADAVSPQAATAKGLDSPVGGCADLLVVSDHEAGNMLAKQLAYLAGALVAGIIVGARVPIVLTSRCDAAPPRLASCAIALLGAQPVSRAA